MTTRTRIAQIFLWLSVISISIYIGGTVFSMSVIVPMWNASPPESVRAFFLGTQFNRTIGNFFGPPFMISRYLPLWVCLIAGWHLKTHRKYFLLTVVCFTFGVAFTLFYIYPINAVLFAQAGGSHSAEEIRQMAHQWVLADRVRFAVSSVGFLSLLRALSIPFPARDHV